MATRAFPVEQSIRAFPAPVVAGAVDPEAFAPVGSGAAIDPGSILTSYVPSGLYTRMTLEDPATVTDTPDETARFDEPVQDIFGTVQSFTLGDMMQLMLWSEDAAPPVDTWMYAALTVGALSSTSFGVAFALIYNATGWRCRHLLNTGAGWTPTDATATSATTRGLIGQCNLGTASTQARVACFPIDAAGVPIGTANSPTSPSTMTGWSVSPNTLTWGGGWLTGVGGAGGSLIKPSPRLLLVKRADIPNTTA